MWIRWTNSFSLRVPTMFILWMCQIFPQPFPKTSHSPKQNHVWCARRNERQNKPIYCLGMPCVRDVGMSIFRSNILQAIFTLSLHSIPVKPFLVVQIAPRSSTWWKNPLSGLHLIVPICKHETWITRRPPTSNWSTKNSWNFKVLWVGRIFTFYHPTNFTIWSGGTDKGQTSVPTL